MTKSNLAEKLPVAAYAEHPSGLAIPTFGDAYGGGFVADIMPFLHGRQGIIIAADAAEGGDFDPLVWDPKYKDAPGATSFLDGLANTLSLDDKRYAAAQACRAWRGGGFEDWHLAAHAVQTRILGNCCPLWTEIEIFKEGAPQAYKPEAYWSSTQSQFDSGYAWIQNFGNGRAGGWSKGGRLRARPVRLVLI